MLLVVFGDVQHILLTQCDMVWHGRSQPGAWAVQLGPLWSKQLPLISGVYLIQSKTKTGGVVSCLSFLTHKCDMGFSWESSVHPPPPQLTSLAVVMRQSRLRTAPRGGTAVLPESQALIRWCATCFSCSPAGTRTLLKTCGTNQKLMLSQTFSKVWLRPPVWVLLVGVCRHLLDRTINCLRKANLFS